MSIYNKIIKLEKNKIDEIKANWNIDSLDDLDQLVELPEIQQIIIHLMLIVEEMDLKITELEAAQLLSKEVK